MSSEFFRVKKGLNISPSDSSTVTSPEIGDIIVDSSDNNKLKRYDDVTSSWKDVGSGAGGINYISNNSDFEGGTVGYATYADAAGLAPIDGTGSPATFVSIGTDSVSPLRGTKSGLISKTANNAQGQGVSYDFTIDVADQAQILRISFDYSTSTNYADGNIRVYVYDVTNNRLIEVVDRDLLASAQGKFVGTFQSSPDSLSYRLIFHIAGTGTTAWTVEIDNVIVGPQTIVKGAIVTDWEAVPTSQLGTLSGLVATVRNEYVRRIGDSLEWEGDIQTTITGATLGEIRIAIPTGYSVDLITGLNNYVGNAQIVDTTTSGVTGGAVGFNSAGYIFFGSTQTASLLSWNSSTNTPIAYDTTDFLRFKVTLPIQGWSSNVVLSEDAGNREIYARAVLSATQSITSTSLTTLQFNTIEEDTTNSFDTGTYTYAVPETAFYDIDLQVYATNMTASDNSYALIRVDGGDVCQVFSNTGGSTAATWKANKVLKLTKGQSVTAHIKTVTDAAYNIDSSSARTFLTIAKRSSPQTISASEVVAAKYKQEQGQNMVVNTSTKIDFEQKIYDTHNAVTIGANWRFTAPQSGYYRVTASALFAAYAWVALNRYQIDVALRNSAGTLITNETIAYKRIETSQTTNFGPSNGSSTEVYMSKGDYIEITLNHNRTGGDALLLGAGNSTNYVTISKITGVS